MRTMLSRLIHSTPSISRLNATAMSISWRNLSTDSNKVDEPFKTKLLVLGGNDMVGSHICAEASGHGVPAAFFSHSRTISWLPVLLGIENRLSTGFLKKALKGVTAVISFVGGLASNSYMYKTANINAIRAASYQGVKRFVYISAADFGVANYSLLRSYERKFKQEMVDIVVESSIDLADNVVKSFNAKDDVETELLTRFPYGGVILRPGFIYGAQSVGIGLETVFQIAKPLYQNRVVGPRFTPPVNVNVAAVAKVAVTAATAPAFPPEIIDVHGIQRYSQQK